MLVSVSYKINGFATRSSSNSKWKKPNSISILESILSWLVFYSISSEASQAYLLRPVVEIVKCWPYLYRFVWKKEITNWGPLGFGYGKVCEVLCAAMLLYYSSHDLSAFDLGPLPNASNVVLVIMISVATNQILSLWSLKQRQYSHSNNHHHHVGVNEMVKDSIGRALTLREQVKIIWFAVTNAICEEMLSRGFFLFEFEHVGKLSFWNANIAQAVSFGVWHYHGIPSGWIGVSLTFVYGLVMGMLWQYGQGLWLPILAHSIADYFIFSVIVRKKPL